MGIQFLLNNHRKDRQGCRTNRQIWGIYSRRLDIYERKVGWVDSQKVAAFKNRNRIEKQGWGEGALKNGGSLTHKILFF